MKKRSSREIVLDVFDFKEVERIPKWLGASPEFVTLAASTLNLPDEEAVRIRMGDDFRRVFSVWRGPNPPLSPGATWRSPFGVERIGLFYGEPKNHPLEGKWQIRDLEEYPWPDPSWADISSVREQAARWEGSYAVLGGEWAPFWHDAIDLVGMENLYYLMYDDEDYVDLLLGRINSYYLEASRATLESAGDLIDILFIGNDFGGQTGPLLGPELFDRFMKPHLAAYADLAHSFGKKSMLHCCGGFRPLMPSIIEAGIDAVHALQPDCSGMDPEGLKSDFGDQIVLNGGLDSRTVLIQGNPEIVREKTRELLAIMSPGGGYIGGASHDFILPETPVDNVLAMFDEIIAWQP
jgi:uroporphyrinogen decarboxylase